MRCTDCQHVEAGHLDPETHKGTNIDTIVYPASEARGLCFDCDHWTRLFEKYAGGDAVVRVDGVHYVMGDEDAGRAMRGFGGRAFLIAFHNGRRVWSTNMWCQGDIPDHWRDRLPDNAAFVNGETWAEVAGTKYLG